MVTPYSSMQDQFVSAAQCGSGPVAVEQVARYGGPGYGQHRIVEQKEPVLILPLGSLSEAFQLTHANIGLEKGNGESSETVKAV